MRISTERANELGLRCDREGCEYCVEYTAKNDSCSISGKCIDVMITEKMQCPGICQDRLKHEMTEQEYDAYCHNRLEIYTVIAENIDWDVDEDDLEALDYLPDEIEIPSGIRDVDEISDYISEVTGFCHNGFTLREEY